jgi:hypothetical protein
MGASVDRGGCEQSDLPGGAFYPCQSASLADQAVAHRLAGRGSGEPLPTFQTCGNWFRNRGSGDESKPCGCQDFVWPPADRCLWMPPP